MEFVNLIFTSGLLEIQEFCQILSLGKKNLLFIFIVTHFPGLCTVGTRPSVEHQSAVQNGRWAVYFPQSKHFHKVVFRDKDHVA